MYKTAAAIAAYEGRRNVIAQDVREAAAMSLLHRQRRQPFQQPHLETGQLDSMIDDFQNRPQNREPSDSGSASPGDPDNDEPDPSPPANAPGENDDTTSRDTPNDSAPRDDHDEIGNHPPDAPGDSGPRDERFEIGAAFPVRPLPVKPPDRRARPRWRTPRRRGQRLPVRPLHQRRRPPGQTGRPGPRRHPAGRRPAPAPPPRRYGQPRRPAPHRTMGHPRKSARNQNRQPNPVRSRRQRLHGGAAPDGRRQGRHPIAIIRRLPAARQSRAESPFAAPTPNYCCPPHPASTWPTPASKKCPLAAAPP